MSPRHMPPDRNWPRVCARCGRPAAGGAIRVLCAACRTREQDEEARIARLYDPAHTPPLPFGAAQKKEKRRATRATPPQP